MKLSVLIPMYNAEKYIERCLDSLMHQDIAVKDYEVLIMDDGSNDGSCMIVKGFSKKYKNVFLYSNKNVGTYSTRNKLLKLAKGDYIYCVDADDYIAHNSLRPLLDHALNNKLDLVGFKTLTTTNTTAFKVEIPFKSIALPNIMTGCEFLYKYPKHRIEIWWYMIRREFAEESKIVFDKNEYNADVLFTLKLFLKAKRVVFYPISIYRYFQSPYSLMRNKNIDKMQKYVENLYLMILDLCEFINNLERHTQICDRQVLQNFKERRDNFLFFLIIKMMKARIDTGAIKKMLAELKIVKAYPIKSYVGSKQFSLVYKVLNYTLNKEPLLLPIAKVFKYMRVFA